MLTPGRSLGEVGLATGGGFLGDRRSQRNPNTIDAVDIERSIRFDGLLRVPHLIDLWKTVLRDGAWLDDQFERWCREPRTANREPRTANREPRTAEEREYDDVCIRARTFIDIWELDRNPRYGKSRAARELGMSVQTLERWLERAGLPRYDSLHEWYLVVRLRQDSDSSSLVRLSLACGRDPATHYRFVRRVTRQNWSELRSLSVPEVKDLALRAWGLRSEA